MNEIRKNNPFKHIQYNKHIEYATVNKQNQQKSLMPNYSDHLIKTNNKLTQPSLNKQNLLKKIADHINPKTLFAAELSTLGFIGGTLLGSPILGLGLAAGLTYFVYNNVGINS